MADGFPPMGAATPYTVTQADRDAIAAAISQDELVELALTLGNIRAPSGKELEVANYVHDWMAREGFSPRKVGASPERPQRLQHAPRPAITTGFKRWRPTPQDLVDSALIYALTALAVCGRASPDKSAARPASAVDPDNPFAND